GERGGALATTVFTGLGVGALWKSLSWIFQVFRTDVGHSMSRTSFFPNATMNVDISPEYMGVGYVIGPRIAGVMFAGGVLSWLGVLPLLPMLGNYTTVPIPSAPGHRLRALHGPALPRRCRPAACVSTRCRRRNCGAPTSATSAPARCSPPV